MARFYAKFNHGIESGLEALTTGNFYERRVITSTTASVLQTALIASRSALSTALYSQIDTGNRNGNQGPIIPPSNTAGNVANIVRSGGNLSWTNIYKTTTIPGVAHPADPRTRPTASIYTDDGNLTAVSPTDSGSINDDLYLSASNAVSYVVSSIKSTFGGLPYTTDGSPYARLGTNPLRTLHSIWHDYNLNYFAWDDFTPGTPQALTATPTPTAATNKYLEGTDTMYIALDWTEEYRSDRAGTTHITASFVRQDNGAVIGSLSDQQITNSDTFYSWSFSGTSFSTVPYVYDVIVSASFRDAVITTHQGPTAQTRVNNVVTVQRVYAVTNARSGATMQALCDDTTNETIYANNVTIVGSTLLYQDKNGNMMAGNYYTDAGSNVNGGSAVSWDGGAATPVTLTCV